MSLTLGDNFSYQASKPLDARLKYDTLAAMKAVADATMYDGCLAYCTATDKTYQWKSTNTVDETLGKWREFQTGGGGHEILDAEDTALTQRDKLKFGNGLTASDNSTDEQTEVEVDVMSSEDMDDVVTPLPSVGARYHKYSTEEQVVGEWIDGKPIYEKTIIPNLSNITIPSDLTIRQSLDIVDISDLNIDECISITGGIVANKANGILWPLACRQDDATNYDRYYLIYFSPDILRITFRGENYFIQALNNYPNSKLIATIRYTKTTA